MDTVYRSHLDPGDKARIERLEIFDEFEEWHMIQEHYAITIGINDERGELAGFAFPEYAATEGTRRPGVVMKSS
jgi:tRNA wybutosine-synthesizing protein 4